MKFRNTGHRNLRPRNTEHRNYIEYMGGREFVTRNTGDKKARTRNRKLRREWGERRL
jgi:hypothetical protein